MQKATLDAIEKFSEHTHAGLHLEKIARAKDYRSRTTSGSTSSGGRSGRRPKMFADMGPVSSVYVDGPTESPHRYSDEALCMWYSWDPQSARWTRKDSAAALLGHIAAHLIREKWWRKTCECAGAEVPHTEG